MEATVYACGPQAFMDSIAAACQALGISDVRTEQFGSRDAVNPGVVGPSATRSPHLPDGAPGDGPTITFARSGLTAPWAEGRYASVLEFAEACDVPTRWACRSGVCHVCTTPIVSGAVRYTDEPPIPAPPGDVLICSCRPDGPLVLDL